MAALLPVEAPGVSQHDEGQTVQEAQQHGVAQRCPGLARLSQRQEQRETGEHRLVSQSASHCPALPATESVTAGPTLSLSSPAQPVSAVVTGGGGAAGECRAAIRHRVLVECWGAGGQAPPNLHLVNGHTDCDAGDEDSQPGDLSSQAGHFSLHVDISL